MQPGGSPECFGAKSTGFPVQYLAGATLAIDGKPGCGRSNGLRLDLPAFMNF